MILVGDIACPSATHSVNLKKIFTEHASIFSRNSLICNFEGLINDDISFTDNKPVLFNHSSVIDALKAANIKAVGMANNHILDMPECFEDTIQHLTKHKVVFSGAANNKSDAYKPSRFLDDGKEIILFNACWDFLLYHQSNPSKGVYVAEIDAIQLLREVRKNKTESPKSAIVIFLHWSLDLETIPYPMYRKMSRALIDSGADLVIGSHSHCVQGGEKYKDGYIVYGLGNFYIPNNTFADSYLSFPEFSRTQLAIEWDSKNNTAKCHWFKYQDEGENHYLLHLQSDKFEESELLQSYSPFSKITDEEYLAYFKTHRRKKFLVPVYVDHNKIIINKLYTIVLKQRGRFARLLSKLRLRKWQN